jgi:hypothetical protein
MPFKEVHKFSATEQATITGNTIYFNPFIIGHADENPFKTEKREYPVDFVNTFEEFYMAKIAIPEGYAIEELPQSKIFALANNAGRYTYNLIQTGNVLTLISSFSINKPMFIQDDYHHLREFYNLVIAKQAEQIVLKKK